MNKYYAGVRVEVQRVWKAMLKATKETNESKELDAIKKAVKQIHNPQNTEKGEQCPRTNAITVVPCMNQEDVHSMARTLQGVAEQTILSGCAEAWVEE